MPDAEFFNQQFHVTDRDIPSGYIYVLRSRSQDPAIASIKNLYKIGFTTRVVEERIANAKNDATYLFADVEIVSTWRVYNIKASAFEHIIHKLFDNVRLQLSVGDATPKEWFVVPYEIIDKVVHYIIAGKAIGYDSELNQLIEL